MKIYSTLLAHSSAFRFSTLSSAQHTLRMDARSLYISYSWGEMLVSFNTWRTRR